MEGWLIWGSDGIVASEISSGFKNNSLTYKYGKRAGVVAKFEDCRFVISRSVVQFRPLAPYNTRG